VSETVPACSITGLRSRELNAYRSSLMVVRAGGSAPYNPTIFV